MARSTTAFDLLVLFSCSAFAAADSSDKNKGVIIGATNRKTKRQADKPHNHDNHDHDQAKVHKCVMPLQATYLTSRYGCVNNAQCANVGDYCQTGNFGGNSCTSCMQDAFGSGVQFAFCHSSAVLCIEATCPKNGTITVRGRSVGKQCTVASTVDAKCGAQDDLYLFRGGYDASASSSSGANVLAWDVETVDVSVDCVADDKFALCEKVGIIDTASVSFTFASTASAPNMCDQGAISLPCPRHNLSMDPVFVK